MFVMGMSKSLSSGIKPFSLSIPIQNFVFNKWVSVFLVLNLLFSIKNIGDLFVQVLDVKLNVVLMGVNMMVLDNFITFNQCLKMLSDIIVSRNHWILCWLHRDATAVL